MTIDTQKIEAMGRIVNVLPVFSTDWLRLLAAGLEERAREDGATATVKGRVQWTD